MILFFDTETTGFVNKGKPMDHPYQPHIVQLAAQLVTHDNETVSEFSFIVDPGIIEVGKEKGVHIPSKVVDIHGIDDQKALDLGVSWTTAIDLFMFNYEKADLMVAHHIQFDKDLIEIARTRRGHGDARLGVPGYCTMQNARDVAKIPPTERMVAAGRTHFKNPKLEECIDVFFGEKLEGAHDAMNDVRACRRVYFYLKGCGK